MSLPIFLACGPFGRTGSLNTRWAVCRFQWLSQSRTPCTSMCRSQQLRCFLRNNLAGHALDDFQGGSPRDSRAKSNRSPHNDLVRNAAVVEILVGDTMALALPTLSTNNSLLLLRPNIGDLRHQTTPSLCLSAIASVPISFVHHYHCLGMFITTKHGEFSPLQFVDKG